MCLTGPTPLVWSCCAIAAAVSEHLTITGSPREHPSLSWRAQGGRGTASADHRGTWREMPGACQPLPSQEQRHSDGSSQFTQQAGQGDTHCKEILILIHTAQPTDATYVCYMYATSNSHEKNNIQTAPCSYTWGALRLANCWGSSIHSTLTCSFPCWGHLSKPRWTPAASCTCLGRSTSAAHIPEWEINNGRPTRYRSLTNHTGSVIMLTEQTLIWRI